MVVIVKTQHQITSTHGVARTHRRTLNIDMLSQLTLTIYSAVSSTTASCLTHSD